MANTHNLFQEFNKTIKLSDKNRDILKSSRDTLRTRVKEGFNKLPPGNKGSHFIEFQSQGSFVMDTIIRPEDADFDLDDGIYFFGGLPEEKRPDPEIFHDLVRRSIDRKNDIEEIIDKPTCIRVKYYKQNGEERGYHIDLPIYYSTNQEVPDLADTKRGWIESSPVEFIAWFEGKIESGFQKSFLFESMKGLYEPYEKWLDDIRKKDCQLRRLVRYMKAWGDTKRKEMPSGIMMTILVASNYIQNERDDVSFRDTLQEIERYLIFNNFKCPRPTPLKDEDLFASFTLAEKEFFKNSLKDFILSANQAIENPNSLDSCLKWKKHLGNRFPCHLAKNDIEGAKIYATAPIKNENSRSAIK